MSWIDDAIIVTAEEKAEAIVKGADQEIRSRYAEILVGITAPYGQNERETWKTQEEEALQYIADSSATCAMIRCMATARGLSVDLMAQKIIANATLFRQASGQILGAQQAELDVLYPDKKLEV